MLTMSAILNFKTHEVDYTKAFPQAPLTYPVYMQIPQGWHVNEMILEKHFDPKFMDKDCFIHLKCNLYGCKQAAHNWCLYLSQGLKDIEFTPSKIDPCLFLHENCIIVSYTNDCLVFSHDMTLIDNLINLCPHHFSSRMKATYLTS